MKIFITYYICVILISNFETMLSNSFEMEDTWVNTVQPFMNFFHNLFYPKIVIYKLSVKLLRNKLHREQERVGFAWFLGGVKSVVSRRLQLVYKILKSWYPALYWWIKKLFEKKSVYSQNTVKPDLSVLIRFCRKHGIKIIQFNIKLSFNPLRFHITRMCPCPNSGHLAVSYSFEILPPIEIIYVQLMQFSPDLI